MKFIISIALFFTISFVSAQSNETVNINNNTPNALKKKIEVVVANKEAKTLLVISVKGVKKIEDLDIENFNKNSFFNLIASKKRKNNVC